MDELGALKQSIDEMSTEDAWWFDYVGATVRRSVPGRRYLNEFGTVNSYDHASKKFLVKFEDTGEELKVDLTHIKQWTFSLGRRRRSPGAEEAPRKNLMDREKTYNGSGKFLVPSADDMLQSCRRRTLRVLDLFAGSESVLEAISTLLAPKRGSQDGFLLEIVSLDIEPQNQDGQRFRGSFSSKYIQGDIRNWRALLRNYGSGFFDMIWCSPPCEKFSRANQVVTDEDLKAAVEQVKCALACIKYYNPCVFYLENPDGRLRLEEVMGKFERYRHRVSYCQYGSGESSIIFHLYVLSATKS